MSELFYQEDEYYSHILDFEEICLQKFEFDNHTPRVKCNSLLEIEELHKQSNTLYGVIGIWLMKI